MPPEIVQPLPFVQAVSLSKPGFVSRIVRVASPSVYEYELDGATSIGDPTGVAVSGSKAAPLATRYSCTFLTCPSLPVVIENAALPRRGADPESENDASAAGATGSAVEVTVSVTDQFE